MTDSTGDYDSSGYGWPLVTGFNPDNVATTRNVSDVACMKPPARAWGRPTHPGIQQSRERLPDFS